MANELSANVIRKLPTPATGNKIYYDSDVAGFGLRVTAGGARSFVLNFRTRQAGSAAIRSAVIQIGRPPMLARKRSGCAN